MCGHSLRLTYRTFENRFNRYVDSDVFQSYAGNTRQIEQILNPIRKYYILFVPKSSMEQLQMGKKYK
jgi:hypothetical protein